jgi:hypothetical protein
MFWNLAYILEHYKCVKATICFGILKKSSPANVSKQKNYVIRKFLIVSRTKFFSFVFPHKQREQEFIRSYFSSKVFCNTL